MTLESADLILAPGVRARVPELIVATRIVSGVRVGESSAALDIEKNVILKKWEGKQANDLNDIPSILSYRTLHARLQPDGKDLLPSVEGMLTRAILKGKFPTINSAVDAGNVVSLTYMVPIGLFDADNIKGVPVLDLAGPHETILAIGKENPLAIQEGTPVLRDDEKILSLIGVRDSKHTMIIPQTRNILVFSWAIGEDKRTILNRALEECKSRLLNND